MSIIFWILAAVILVALVVYLVAGKKGKSKEIGGLPEVPIETPVTPPSEVPPTEEPPTEGPEV